MKLGNAFVCVIHYLGKLITKPTPIPPTKSHDAEATVHGGAGRIANKALHAHIY